MTELFLNLLRDPLTTLGAWLAVYGVWLYVILFLIFFAETGLVFFPFLPGDSLLFAAGAIVGSHPDLLSIGFLAFLLVIAAIAGDNLNYAIGQRFGRKIPLQADHLQRTEEFLRRYGKRAIVLARFVPIVRTYAPFVAGMGRMHYSSFFRANVIGGLIWINLFLFLGFFFGGLPQVKSQFQYVVLGIISVSMLPIVWEFAQHHRRRKQKSI